MVEIHAGFRNHHSVPPFFSRFAFRVSPFARQRACANPKGVAFVSDFFRRLAGRCFFPGERPGIFFTVEKQEKEDINCHGIMGNFCDGGIFCEDARLQPHMVPQLG